MNFKRIFLILPLFLCLNLFAQNQGNTWYFGENAGFDFSDGDPILVSGGLIESYSDPLEPESAFAGGSSCISDSEGNFLFYSNGENIWDANHEVMPNGSGLSGGYASSHPALIIPVPQSDMLFYVFTTDMRARDLEGGLRYSVVNMCLNNGMGNINSDQKDLLLLDLVSEKLAAITHENGEDIWLIAHKYNSDAFYAYLVTASGIEAPIITNIGFVHEGPDFEYSEGKMNPSHDGNKIGVVSSIIGLGGPPTAELFDFDKATGILSNAITLMPYLGLSNSLGYGIEFSPDNTKVYVTTLAGVRQFDLNTGPDETAINNSITGIGTSGGTCIPADIKLGPNGKLYVTDCAEDGGIDIIHNPNGIGEACVLQVEAIPLGDVEVPRSFPSFLSFDYYNNSILDCPDVIGIGELDTEDDLSIYPNPSNGTFFIDLDNSKVLNIEVYNSIGNKVLDIYEVNLNKELILDITSGIYFMNIQLFNGSFVSKKLVIQ